MSVLSKLGGIVAIVGASAAGGWLGDELRSNVTSPQRHVSRTITTEQGQQQLSELMPAYVLPGIVVALLAGKPRTIWAFVGSAVINALVGDVLERQLGTIVQQR